MSILLSHWHCILPAAVLIIAMILMNGKSKDKDKDDKETITHHSNTDEV
ncbi:hypothetical protein LQZ18_07830 [Lachnospiraceae bacterium ZAX-1]